MGIMPADRDQKWQRIFRRFGLPGQPMEQDREAQDSARPKTDADEKKPDRKQPPKRARI